MRLGFRPEPSGPDLRSPDGFSRFYARHSTNVLRFFARRVGIPEVALDLTAETFAAAYISRKRFRGRTDEEAAGWLYAIARVQLAGYRRRGETEKQAIGRLGIEVPELSREDHERIEEMIDAGAIGEPALRELESLTSAERDAIELRVLQERSYRDVAERLGISQDAARARVSRGLRNLEMSLSETDPTTEVSPDGRE